MIDSNSQHDIAALMRELPCVPNRYFWGSFEYARRLRLLALGHTRLGHSKRARELVAEAVQVEAAVWQRVYAYGRLAAPIRKLKG